MDIADIQLDRVKRDMQENNELKILRYSGETEFNGRIEEKKKNLNFRSHRWGSSLQGLQMRDPPLGPPSTLRQFLNFCPPKYVIVLGVGGSPHFFIYWNPNTLVT